MSLNEFENITEFKIKATSFWIITNVTITEKITKISSFINGLVENPFLEEFLVISIILEPA